MKLDKVWKEVDKVKQVKIAKQYGVWYYTRVRANDYNDLRFNIIELYNNKKEYECSFGSMDEMKHYIRTGEFI